jgi:hypothetical protein
MKHILNGLLWNRCEQADFEIFEGVLLATEVASITGIISAYKDDACMTDGFADGKSEVAPAA